MSDIKASVIISVYKDTHALCAVLNSLKLQTESHFEIIISEDGCSKEMAIFVQQYNWFCPFEHLTQEDIGWRKNRALNRAICAAKAPWIIFIDGDCVVHNRFVEMHLRYAEENRVLLGKRVKLSEPLSRNLKNLDISVFDLDSLMWKRLLCHDGCRYVDEGIFVTLFFKKEFSQQDLGSLASGQLLHILVETDLIQSECMADFLHFGIDHIKVVIHQKVLDRSQFLHHCIHFFLGCVTHSVADLIHPRFHFKEERECAL